MNRENLKTSFKNNLSLIAMGFFLCLLVWALESLMHGRFFPDRRILLQIIGGCLIVCVGLFGAFRISQRMHAEERRRSIEEIRKSSEIRYQLLFESTKDGILILDAGTGHITDVNPFFMEMMGYTQNELVGKKFWEIGPFQNGETCGVHFQDLSSKEYVRYDDLRLETCDGRPIDVEFVSTLYRAYNKTVIQCNIRDVTERKQAEEKIRQLSQAVEQSPSIVMITDLNANIVYVNPKFSQITGYPLAEIAGKNPKVLKSGEMSADSYKALWEILLKGGEWRGEFHNRRKDDELYWEFASISSIKNPSGKVTHYIKVGEDITERKRLEAVKDEFVNMVSHELRAPLTAIKQSLWFIAEGMVGDINEEQKHMLDIGKSSIDRLARFINDVLDFQQLRTGRMKFNFGEHDLNDVVMEVQETMLPLAAGKNIDLLVDPDRRLPKISIDKDKIIQVLINLVNNALKFTEKGSIKIAMEKGEDHTISVSVTDTGIGIKQEDIGKLFKSFSQVGPAESRKKGSSGLGLAISKEIVQLHNGRIWAESEYGKGTSIRVVLPLKPLL